MKPVIFFNHIDRSEALESFIEESLYNLRINLGRSKWIISKEKNNFIAKCIGNQVIEKKMSIYVAVKDVICHIKRIQVERLDNHR